MPIRTCTGCHTTSERAALVRVVLDPAGRVVVDHGKRLPGRGAWLHAQRACVESVVKGSGFSKSFRRKTRPLDVEQLWQALNEEEGSRA